MTHHPHSDHPSTTGTPPDWHIATWFGPNGTPYTAYAPTLGEAMRTAAFATRGARGDHLTPDTPNRLHAAIADARQRVEWPADDTHTNDERLNVVFDAVTASVSWLDAHNGRGNAELAARILKVTEEAGEAAAAWIGLTGQNPRKGITHTRDDVAGELADMAMAALVAIASLGADPVTVLATKAAHVRSRMTRPEVTDHA